MNMENLDRQPVAPIVDPDLSNAAPNPEPHQKLPFGRLAVPLFLQSLLICSIAAQSIYALATGTTVVLKTMPVDPYDLLRGYYQILSYDISSFNTLNKLPGWKNLKRPKGSANLDRNQHVYVTLVKTNSNSPTLQAWKPVAIDAQLPTNLSADKIAIRGVSNGNSIIYGLETYYMPEDRKDGVNADINSTRSSGNNRNLLVEVKVDNRGVATPVGLWVGDKQYRF
jgi:uncharacterized membrane-anchored protein